jgi:hypothetical protein
MRFLSFLGFDSIGMYRMDDLWLNQDEFLHQL